MFQLKTRRLTLDVSEAIFRRDRGHDVADAFSRNTGFCGNASWRSREDGTLAIRRAGPSAKRGRTARNDRGNAVDQSGDLRERVRRSMDVHEIRQVLTASRTGLPRRSISRIRPPPSALRGACLWRARQGARPPRRNPDSRPNRLRTDARTPEQDCCRMRSPRASRC